MTKTEPLLSPSGRQDDGTTHAPEQQATTGTGITSGGGAMGSLDVEQGTASPATGDHADGKPPISRNIPLVLAYTAFIGTGRSLWNQSVLSAFIFLLFENRPEYVGFISGIQGIMTVVASFPSGFLADAYRRDVIVKAGSFVGVLAVGLTSGAVSTRSGLMLCAAVALWGVFSGMSNTGTFALFADSIPRGERSHYFTQKMILQKLGNTAGPLTGMVMFTFLGDEWTLRDCALVIIAGQVLCLPAVLVLCFVSDDYAVSHHHEEEVGRAAIASAHSANENNSTPNGNVATAAISEERDGREVTAATSASNWEKGEIKASSNAAKTQLFDEGQTSFCGLFVDLPGGVEDYFPVSLFRQDMSCFCIPEHRIVPVFVAITDLIGGFAAGMSIRYFPIFFMDNLALAPTTILVLYTVSPLSQALLGKGALVLSRKIGRPQTTVSFKSIGVLLMVVMLEAYRRGFPPYIICTAFVLRQAFMNSTASLTKSLLMDSVPRSERGKWCIVESVHTFSWSGSAALGGLLVAARGITFNFYFTSLLQFVATFPLILLFERVGLEKPEVGASPPPSSSSPSPPYQAPPNNTNNDNNKGVLT